MTLEFTKEEMILIVRGLERLEAGISYRLLKKIDEWLAMQNKKSDDSSGVTEVK